VQPSRVTDLLWPNRPGRSTTMRVILGLDAPTGERDSDRWQRLRPDRSCNRVDSTAGTDSRRPGGSPSCFHKLDCCEVIPGSSRPASGCGRGRPVPLQARHPLIVDDQIGVVGIGAWPTTEPFWALVSRAPPRYRRGRFGCGSADGTTINRHPAQDWLAKVAVPSTSRDLHPDRGLVARRGWPLWFSCLSWPYPGCGSTGAWSSPPERSATRSPP
jgi:hypothetical protein